MAAARQQMNVETIGANNFQTKKTFEVHYPQEKPLAKETPLELAAGDLPFTRQFYDLGDVALPEKVQQTNSSLWEQNGKLLTVTLSALALLAFLWQAIGTFYEMKSDIKNLTREVDGLHKQISDEEKRKERERDENIEKRINDAFKKGEERGYGLGAADAHDSKKKEK